MNKCEIKMKCEHMPYVSVNGGIVVIIYTFVTINYKSHDHTLCRLSIQRKNARSIPISTLQEPNSSRSVQTTDTYTYFWTRSPGAKNHGLL